MNTKVTKPVLRLRTSTVLLGTIAFILTVYFLRSTYVVFMPVVCALFITILLFPVYQWMRFRLPPKWEWLSLVFSMLIFVAVLALILGAFAISIQTVAAKAPLYAERFTIIKQNFLNWAQNHNLPLTDEMLQGSEFIRQALGSMTRIFQSLWTVLAYIVLIFFLVLLMLLEWREWRDKIHQSFRYQRMIIVMDTIDVIGEKIRHYLGIRTFISFISGVIEGLWLWFMGVDFAFLFGFLCFLLNYIPNIGSVIAIVPAVLIALIQMGPGKAALALTGLIIIEQVIGNFIDPRMQGKALHVSPTVVLVSLLFWGWIWGVVGAVLAVPLTVSIIITCAHIEAFRSFALLLSQSTDMQDLIEDTHNDPNKEEMILMENHSSPENTPEGEIQAKP